MAASKSGMELAPMKQLLNKATPKTPVPFAFGMGDEAFALLLLDKVGKNPKTVLKSLEDEFKEAKNTRCGTAVVEPERASLVKFIVNRPITGMAKRLVKTLKGTGYNKAEIVLEDGTVVEGAADEEEAPAAAAPGAPAAPPPPAAGPTAEEKANLAAELSKKLAALIPRIAPAGVAQPTMLDALKKFATDANVNIKTGNLVYANVAITQLATALDKIVPAGAPAGAPPAPPPPPAAGQPAFNAADLSKKLAELIPRIGPAGAANPELLAQLKKFATDANVNIKTNNLTYANVAITQLSNALAKAGAPAGADATAGDLAKTGDIWVGAGAKVKADIDSLRAELVKTYQAEGIDVTGKFNSFVAPLMTKLEDTSLATMLQNAGKAKDPAERGKLIDEASKVLAGYEATLSLPAVTDLDDNPFVKLGVKDTLSTALGDLSKAIKMQKQRTLEPAAAAA
jgi:hypothetical protein